MAHIKKRQQSDLTLTNAPLSTAELLPHIQQALDDKKAENIAVLTKLPAGAPAEALVIATATSERHAATLADSVTDKLSKFGECPMGEEGSKGSDWVLVDYGNIVVHIFSAEARALYNLEKLWSPVFDDPDQDDSAGQRSA